MDETSIETRTGISDVSGTIPIAAKRELHLLLCLVNRGIGGAVDYEIGSSRAHNLYDLIAIGNINFRGNRRYHLEFKVRRARA
jgi:hypothetical protein